MDPLSAVLTVGGKLLDKFFPDPEAKAKAQQELLRMAQAGELQEFALIVQDRDSARKREMALGGRMNGVLAVFILLGFFAVVGMMFFDVIPEPNKEVLYMLLGALGTMATQVVAYYFGSSAGSKQKTMSMMGK